MEQINRRTILKGGLAGLAAASLPAGIARAAEPKRGGHLVIGVDGATSAQSLHPATWSQSHDQLVGMQVYNTLIEMGTNGLEPSLAESWEGSADLKVWRINLRSGVTFHNGKTLTADDVVYSYNLYRAEGSLSPARPLLLNIADIAADGAGTVVFTLEQADVDFPYILTTVMLAIVADGEDPAAGNGTGAYVLELFEPGTRSLVKRNESYFRSDRAFVETVETLGINDLSARINGLASGQLHLINRPDPTAAARLAGIPGVEVHNAPGRGFYTFAMRTDIAPFEDNNLRLAMKYGIDRNDAISKIAGEYGTIANDHPIPPTDPMFDPSMPQREFDPDKAAFHYRESGHSGPLTLTTSDVGFPGADRVAALFRETAAQAGIDIAINAVPGDSYMDTAFGKADICPLYWNARPTANMAMTLAYHSAAPWNAGYLKNARFDQLLEASRAEADEGSRKQMYSDMQHILHESGSDLTLMFFNVLDASRKEVKGFEPSPYGEMSGLRAAEKVWLED